MMQELSLVTDWLTCASSQITASYFQLPVAEKEDAIYRERVYCYELYHRWRSHWRADFPFSLGGEIDKSGHPLIRKPWKPDFLVHIPGCMTNLLVVEVKPGNADPAEMISDLKKLTQFRRDLKDANGKPANYQAAYFWLYGLTMDDWPNVSKKLLARLGKNPEFDQTLISCFIHEASGTRAMPARWEQAD